MKKKTINFSWPATLSFSTDNSNENELFTRGKLKVFYKGETADHRYFSKEFSEELIKSLPYTPVVSHYDEDKDDFVGHATQQDIYGIVDPCGEVSFETDDKNVNWCVCDVVFYTKRPDKVGEIAKKIEGHSQSLELDPSTVKYTINYDEKRHFKNIEFTAGKFIGVSVLGKDQKPAFTGSAFFSDAEFEEAMRQLKNYCKSNNGQTQSGGDIMTLQEFMKLSWGDISSKVETALTKEYSEEAYTYIVDMFDDSAIVRWYSYVDGSVSLLRVKYSCTDNGEIVLGDVNEVHVVYEDMPTTTDAEPQFNEPVSTSTTEDNSDEHATDPAPSSNLQCGNEGQTEDPMVAEETPEEPLQTTVDSNNAAVETPAPAVNQADMSQINEPISLDAPVTQTSKVSAENEDKLQEETSGSTSFTESERAELEALKREKKVSLVDSYKDHLSDEEYNAFIAKIDASSFEDLELELLKKFKEDSTNTRQERAFAFAPIQTPKKADTLNDWVRENLNL